MRKKQIAIVTGASSGLGAEYARQLNRFIEVDELWMIARREDLLSKLKSEIENDKCKIKIISLDLTDRSSFKIIKDLLENQELEVKLLINLSSGNPSVCCVARTAPFLAAWY